MKTTKKPGLLGAILVGGQSRRMGTNKALLRLEPYAPMIVETIAQKVSAVAAETVLVGSASADYSFLGLPQIADIQPDQGPLVGIYSALVSSEYSHVLVVSCDLPFLSGSLLRYMAEVPRDYDVLVPETDRLQPLHSIYSRSCIPLIANILRSGSARVMELIEQANVRVIDIDTMREHDPSLLSTFNMNTPDSLESAKLENKRSIEK